MAAELITVSEYARRRGCDEKAVRKAILAGRITPIERDGRRLIDPRVADIQWAENTRARADSRRGGGRSDWRGGGETAGYAAHRERREAAEAVKAELQARQLAGELVERTRVDAAVFEAFRALRERVINCARDMADVAAGKSDAREIELALDAELRKAFEVFEARDIPELRARMERQ